MYRSSASGPSTANQYTCRVCHAHGEQKNSAAVSHTKANILQLFEESQEITFTSRAPATDSSTDSSGKSRPNYSAPFEFTFPSSSTSCACQLPPTLYRFSSLLSIRVEYIVVLALRHHIVCGLKRTKKIQRELSFRSEPGSIVLTQSTAGYLPANTLCPRMNETLRVADKTCSNYPGWLPPYTSSLLLEVQLPSPPVLTTGHATPVQLVLHTPPELLGGDIIYLRSITVQLKSSVIATSGSTICSSTDSTPCWSSKGRIHIDRERFELDSGAWVSLGISYALPTCSSCALNLSHTVEVIAGISRGEGVEIQVSRLFV